MGSRALARHRKAEAAAGQDTATWDDPDAVVVCSYVALPDLQDADGIARARLLSEREVRKQAETMEVRSTVRWYTVPALPPGGPRRVLDDAVGVDPTERDRLLAFLDRNPRGALVAAALVVDPPPELRGRFAPASTVVELCGSILRLPDADVALTCDRPEHDADGRHAAAGVGSWAGSDPSTFKPAR